MLQKSVQYLMHLILGFQYYFNQYTQYYQKEFSLNPVLYVYLKKNTGTALILCPEHADASKQVVNIIK